MGIFGIFLLEHLKEKMSDYIEMWSNFGLCQICPTGDSRNTVWRACQISAKLPFLLVRSCALIKLFVWPLWIYSFQDYTPLWIYWMALWGSNLALCLFFSLSLYHWFYYWWCLCDMCVHACKTEISTLISGAYYLTLNKPLTSAGHLQLLLNTWYWSRKSIAVNILQLFCTKPNAVCNVFGPVQKPLLLQTWVLPFHASVENPIPYLE